MEEAGGGQGNGALGSFPISGRLVIQIAFVTARQQSDGNGRDQRTKPVSELVAVLPDTPIEHCVPRHVGAQAAAEMFDPAIFCLRDLAPDEIARGECRPHPPIAGQEADYRLDCRRVKCMFKEAHFDHVLAPQLAFPDIGSSRRTAMVAALNRAATGALRIGRLHV